MDNAIQPVMPIGGNDAFGGNSFMWIFGLLILMGMFNGGFGFGNANNGYATSNEVQRGFDNQNAMANQREILNAVNMQGQAGIAATNQTFHDSLAAMQNLYNETSRDIAALQVGQANALANQNACCCETKQLIAESKYENAMNLAGFEQRLTSKLDQNKIEALQAQVNQLQLQQATAGMLRFPNQWSYGAGQFPPIFGGCNTNV